MTAGRSAVGIFGGTFDPIHYGHLRTAFEVLQALDFTKVLFIPSGDPPHRGTTFADAELRLRMVAAATAEEQRFVVDDCEVRRRGPSYTVETLVEKRSQYTGEPLGLIMGMDAFLGLVSWHRWEELLGLAHIIVAHRPGWRRPDSGPLGELLSTFSTEEAADLHAAPNGRIHVHAVTQLEIASSDIRELVAAGEDPRYLLPSAARAIIVESGCYA